MENHAARFKRPSPIIVRNLEAQELGRHLLSDGSNDGSVETLSRQAWPAAPQATCVANSFGAVAMDSPWPPASPITRIQTEGFTDATSRLPATVPDTLAGAIRRVLSKPG